MKKPLTITLVDYRNGGKWKVNSDRSHKLPVAIVKTEDLIDSIQAAWPTPQEVLLRQEQYDMGAYAPMEGVTVLMPRKADLPLRAQKTFPLHQREIGVLIRSTYVKDPAWKALWAPAISQIGEEKQYYDGEDHLIVTMRVIVPTHMWRAQIDGPNFRNPELFVTHGKVVDGVWAGGNHQVRKPCFGTLNNKVSREGVSTIDQFEGLFFGSPFSAHIQTPAWHWNLRNLAGVGAVKFIDTPTGPAIAPESLAYPYAKTPWG